MTAPHPPPATHQVTINAGGDVYYAGRDLGLARDERRAAAPELDLDPVTRPPVFCGRRREIARIGRLLLRPWSRTRVVVLDGLAGSGKTTLMSEAAYRYTWLSARRRRRRFGRRRKFDGVLRVGLGGSTDEPMSPAALLRHLAGRLGIAAGDLGEDALLRRYRTVIGRHRLLVLLDDAAGAEQIREVVAIAGRSAVLVTSRVELSGLPGAARIGVESFAAKEALDLLRAEVGAARVDAAPREAASIVRRCGYLPLAIHLAGGRLGGASRSLVSLTELDADLAAAGLSALAPRGATADASARTMREIFDGVYRRLDPPLQQLFRLLGGEPRLVDAATAATLADLPVRDAAELLRDLHAYRLVEPAGGQDVYRLHDLLHEFAQELAARHPEETAAAARRLIARRLTDVEAAIAGLHAGERFGPAQAVGAAAADSARQARAAGDDETCWRIVSRLAELFDIVGFPDDWPALHTLGAGAAEAAGGDEAAKAMIVADATFRVYRWQWAESIALLAARGGPEPAAHGTAGTGQEPATSVAADSGPEPAAHVAAGTGHEPATSIAADNGPEPATHVTADSGLEPATHVAADTSPGPATSIAADSGPEPATRVAALLGRAYAGAGDAAGALAEATRSLRLAEASGDPLARCRALRLLGAAQRAAGDLAASAGRLREAVEAAEAYPLDRSRALTESARTFAATGRLDDALAALTEAADLDAAAGDRVHLARVHADRADLRRRPYARRRALADLGAALESLTGRVDGRVIGRVAGGDATATLLEVAEGHLALGRPEEATIAAEHTGGSRVEVLEPRRMAVIGELAAAEGRLGDAVRVLDPIAGADPRAALLLGEVYARLGDYAEAGRLHRYAGATAGDARIAALAGARAAEARAAEDGSVRARLRIRGRTRPRWPAWPGRILAVFLCFGTVGIAAHDSADVHVSPAGGVRALVICALAVLLAARLRSYAAGALLGYLAVLPVAAGLILLTSDQVRERGDTWSLAGYALAAVAVAGAVLAARRSVPWLAVMVLGIVALGGSSVLGAPSLSHAPVAPAWWTGIGIALLAAGAAWLPLAALSLPGTYGRVRAPALIAAPIAGGVLAVLLGAGLGRQTDLLWPGTNGPDWHLALLGAATAAGCAVAGLLGPGRFSAGVLSGLAWFWGINGLLLGSAHSDDDSPAFWTHPIAYWHWLTGATVWTWLMPLLTLVAVGALGLASSRVADAAPSYYAPVRIPRELPEPDGLRDRLRAARRARVRLGASRACVVIAAIFVGSYLDALAGPPAERVQGWVTLLLVGLVLAGAAYLHPDLAAQARALVQAGAVRWAAVAGLLAVTALIAAVNVRGIDAHGWSRGPVAGLLLAAAGLGFAVGIAPAWSRAPRLAWIGDGAFLAGCGLVMAAALTNTDSVSELIQIIGGAVLIGGAIWLFDHLRERRNRRSGES